MSETITPDSAPVIIPDTDTIQVQGTGIEQAAQAIAKVESQHDFNQASDFLTGTIKSTLKRIDEKFKPSIDAAKANKKSAETARKEIVTLCDEIKAPFLSAETIIKNGLADFTEKQEAEQRRIEQEARDLALKEAEDARLRQAEAAEARGDSAEVDKLLSEPVTAPVVKTASMKPKAEGVQVKKLYKGKLVNIKALCAAIANGDPRAPVTLVTVNQKELNKLASTYKDQFDVPGCELDVSRNVAATAKEAK
jgi:hypothetical protein